ncbi:hypothetical protein SAMD00019534_022860 [Acytostelium subglobosum LB1]|uniref:hypothetical protein n=1 Tax=Acytostelium subglobosum LB1 TaxID=1410327 RepID=UPI000644E502|nr:hypothetical protein SAMD00019534_022860 [Acytostelium subglobosum LB1]GAM19111.1 hypothetical protein SAMD00019534_022860 [Acytostelium subglobosum LB1]|eukprot:XP_012757038.1 hypothetical protein SAMD00019534_022860 [Acytostelium subglobosum LB1]
MGGRIVVIVVEEVDLLLHPSMPHSLAPNRMGTRVKCGPNDHFFVTREHKFDE